VFGRRATSTFAAPAFLHLQTADAPVVRVEAFDGDKCVDSSAESEENMAL
jgi:hypothetical protein